MCFSQALVLQCLIFGSPGFVTFVEAAKILMHVFSCHLSTRTTTQGCPYCDALMIPVTGDGVPFVVLFQVFVACSRA